MEQNETGCHAPQAPILCVNNCGFFGAVATMNMCSKCYKDLVLKQEQTKFAASSIQSIVNGTSSVLGKHSDANVASAEAQTVSLDTATPLLQASVALPTTEEAKEVKDGPTRCGCCRKRVGLTGFNCRCGGTFCSSHRYSDKHQCSFDYRSAGQEAIAKANPLIKAEKLDKI